VQRFWIALSLTPGMLLSAPASRAADEVVPTEGTRVRVTAPCRFITPSRNGDCRVTGKLARWAPPDTLAISEADHISSFALADVKQFEVSDGSRSYRFLGAGVGLVVGTTATILIANSGGSTSLCDRSANQDALSSKECLGIYALGGVVGAGLGYLVGSLIHSESWRPVPLEK